MSWLYASGPKVGIQCRATGQQNNVLVVLELRAALDGAFRRGETISELYKAYKGVNHQFHFEFFRGM